MRAASSNTTLPVIRRGVWVSLAAVLTMLAAGCATRTPAPVVERPRAPPAVDAAALQIPVPPPPIVDAAPPPPPPPERDWRPEFYTVKRGDTLFAVALEHGLDYRELAAMNNIENLNVIRVGQVLRVRGPNETFVAGAGPATAPLVSVPAVTDGRPVAAVRTERPMNSETYKTGPKGIKLPFSDAAVAQLRAEARSETVAQSSSVVPGTPIAAAAPSASQFAASAASGASAAASAPAAGVGASGSAGPLASAAPVVSGASPTLALPPAASADGEDNVDWGWPVRGRMISGFSESASLKGIDIAGTKGAAVVSTAPGRVVYAGSGLRGYGKLVIVKHNKTYLSAYAHLDQISIKEGQNVTKGQEIGKMGNSDADQVKLHFEIRSLGKPVDPLRYLPRG